MTFTYTGTPTSIGEKVRLYIPDRIVDEAIFSDEEISVFLDEEDGNILLAVADALETISTDEALVQKVIKIGDLQTNGAQTAKALQDRAASMRARALDSADVPIGDLFDWAEFQFDPFTKRESAVKSLQRAGYIDWWVPML